MNDTNSQPQTQPKSDLPSPNSASSAAPNSELRSANFAPTFPRSPGESPRAYHAFITFFRLGSSRSLQAVADKTAEPLGTVKNWSSKFDWIDRINRFNSGIVEQELQAEVEARRKAAADWQQRTAEYREQEWEFAQRFQSLVQCCIENFGDRDIEKMRLSELSRAFSIATNVSRSALQQVAPEDNRPKYSPIQNELLALLEKMPTPQPPPKPTPTTNRN